MTRFWINDQYSMFSFKSRLCLPVIYFVFTFSDQFFRFQNSDCHYNDIRVIRHTGPDYCNTKCLYMRNCNSFVYLKKQRKCWLKSVCKKRRRRTNYDTYLPIKGTVTHLYMVRHRLSDPINFITSECIELVKKNVRNAQCNWMLTKMHSNISIVGIMHEKLHRFCNEA